MMSREDLMEALRHHIDAPLPESFEEMSLQQLKDVRAYLDDVMVQEREGLDKMFGSISHTLKYIPNFIIHAVTLKFIDPPVAARISNQLELKQAISVSSGLPPDYVAEAAHYMDSQLAAEILVGLPKRKSSRVFAEFVDRSPYRALDVLACLEDRWFHFFREQSVSFDVSEDQLSVSRRETLERLG